jgi:hypothetical protein
MKRLILPLLVSLPFAVQAMPCNLPASSNGPDLKVQARVSPGKAHQIALDSIGGSARSTDDGRLEVMDGCVVYRYDFTLRGRKGHQEVVVDAGNGDVLSSAGDSSRLAIEPRTPVSGELR